MDLPTAPGETFCVYAKPNASDTEYLGYRAARGAHVFRIAAPAREGEANEELLGFLKAELGVRCAIVHGRAGKKKLLRVLE